MSAMESVALAELIASNLDRLFGGREFGPATQDYKLADAILAAGYRKVELGEAAARFVGDELRSKGWVLPRTITTAEELDALPVGAVIRTSGDEDHFDPRVAVKTATLAHLSYWAVSGDEDGFESSSDELDDLPATVLFAPKES